MRWGFYEMFEVSRVLDFEIYTQWQIIPRGDDELSAQCVLTLFRMVIYKQNEG